ncbi:hypothetical protein VdG1_04770 [Verticillium dahliae VDG1]|nr:hypothetical protein VdG1_04770 [Verticillium dahliae VDG1]
MFAVPGWSVSADALKPETQVKESASKPSKRKRAGAGGAKQEVTTDNVANLWERVIEGKPAPQKKKADKGGKKAAAKQNGKPEKDDAQPASKRQKAEDGSAVTKDEPERDGAPAKDGQEPPRKKTKKEKMREKKAALKLAEETKSAVELDSEKPAEDAEMAEANDVEEPQQEPRQELEQEQPAKQSKKDKKEKAKADKAAKPESTSSKPAAAPPLPPAVKLTPLQASMRAKLVSARFRHLNETLYTRPSAEALSLFTDSPDMFSDPSPHVTRADIANLPLADGAADVAIFCLALMGTNWLDFIEEAYRILRWKGELWVAEIKSRFGPAARHAGAKGRSGGGVVEHSVGNRKKTEKVGKKDKAEIASAEAAADGEELAVEVDGNDDKRGETDVSAFVEALQKRGFVLQGKADLSNKMFVRMRFTKGMAPVKGKCVEKTPKEVLEKQKKQKRFQWESKEIEEEVDESPILKPCVYKLR